jgi:hypothetical protein
MKISKHPKVNIVVACWGGYRREHNPEYDSDRGLYVKLQVAHLQKYVHRLAQITFAVNVDPQTRDDFAAAIASIPSKIQKSKVVVVEKPNYGMSYGLFSYVYGMYKDQFDYYIFIEDDRVFVLDNFDDLLINEYKVLPNCGYLCGMVGGDVPHAAITEGIASAKSLGMVWSKFGKLRHNEKAALGENYFINESEGQVSFSRAFLAVGLNLFDMQYKFVVPYWDSVKKILIFHRGVSQDRPIILCPVQIIDKRTVSLYING